ncbi:MULTISPECIES: GNAT family N-acetyltransferase [Actinoalloteichus]|uniref:Acetyltransferase n=1 Tax=Actinoalloteichus fjordicus TaxID=1612552 RepID=A0AAC9LDQ7_9PSEU|nr:MULTISPECIES: GNAT family N-acetyltransferase [Actinoalloteichus]APU15461.1 acetyltransferase [Actinoalloteichus fjordicus]APU21529.1 acetyltransferase [Actinoalloteichus sp. GBA129-24]
MVQGDVDNGWAVLTDDGRGGGLRALRRPDGRRHLFFLGAATDEYGPLVETALRALDTDLYVEVDEADAAALTALTERGFVVHRSEHRYAVPTDPAVTGLGVGLGDVELRSVMAADPDRWRVLDDELRGEVPGAGGWRNDPVSFASDTFADPEFDPALYLIAVDRVTDAYLGLTRVWNRQPRPRLGLIGTAADHRRRGVARHLLAEAFGVLHRRGHHEVTCEVDERNTASNALLLGVGARREGGGVELLRRGAAG